MWKQKIGIEQRFLGNANTEWGIKSEPEAEKRFREGTGHCVEHHAFKILDDGDQPLTSWLGASPDCLIPATLSPGTQPHLPMHYNTCQAFPNYKKRQPKITMLDSSLGMGIQLDHDDGRGRGLA